MSKSKEDLLKDLRIEILEIDKLQEVLMHIRRNLENIRQEVKEKFENRVVKK